MTKIPTNEKKILGGKKITKVEILNCKKARKDIKVKLQIRE